MPTTTHPPRSPRAAGVAYLRWRLGLGRDELAQSMAERGHAWSKATVVNIENDRRDLSLREERDLRRIAGLDDEDFLIDGIGLTQAPDIVRYPWLLEGDGGLAAAA